MNFLRLLTLLSGVVLASSVPLTQETWHTVTEGKTLFVKFYAPWCVSGNPCWYVFLLGVEIPWFLACLTPSTPNPPHLQFMRLSCTQHCTPEQVQAGQSGAWFVGESSHLRHCVTFQHVHRLVRATNVSMFKLLQQLNKLVLQPGQFTLCFFFHT